jgi:hypothetical protein
MTSDMAPAEITTGGILDNMTRDRSEPLANAIMNPPRNVDISWRNFPTFINHK